MREFIDRLGRELAPKAETEAKHFRSQSAADKRWYPTPRSALAAVAVVAILVVVGVSALRSEPAVALPALARPSLDASFLGTRLSPSTVAGADLHAARQFDSHNGAAYLFATDTGEFCIVLPEGPSEAGYAQNCAPAERVKESGLVATLVARPGQAARSVVAIAVPEGVTRVRATSASGHARDLSVDAGIVSASFTEDVTISYNGVPPVKVPAQVRVTSTVTACGDGRTVTLPKNKTPEDVCGTR